MIEPSELDKAQLVFEFRQLYKDIGFNGALQVLYELVVSASTLAEIIAEERKRENE